MTRELFIFAGNTKWHKHPKSKREPLDSPQLSLSNKSPCVKDQCTSVKICSSKSQGVLRRFQIEMFEDANHACIRANLVTKEHQRKDEKTQILKRRKSIMTYGTKDQIQGIKKKHWSIFQTESRASITMIHSIWRDRKHVRWINHSKMWKNIYEQQIRIIWLCCGGWIYAFTHSHVNLRQAYRKYKEEQCIKSI